MDYYLPFGKHIKLGQPFGSRPNMPPNPAGGHNGDDWLTWIGEPVRAAGDGEVVFAGQFDTTYEDNFGWNLNFGGNMIVLNMDGQYAPYFEYGHMSELFVKTGQRVKAGQIIGLTGNTDGGTNVSTGPHCHVGCLPWNYNLNTNTYGRVNPRQYMTKYWDASDVSLNLQGVTITPLANTSQEDDELSKVTEEQIARIYQIAEAGEEDRIREKIVAIDNRTAQLLDVTKYVKGADEESLYEIDEATGLLRGITLAEWEVTGKGYRVLPQATVNLLLGK